MVMGRSNPRLIQPGSAIHTRVESPVTVPDLEAEPTKNIMLALMHIADKYDALSRIIEDRSHVVDEYLAQEFPDSIPSGGTIELQPVYEQLSERIENILVIGPISTAFTLQLGDRLWSGVTNAQGFYILSPVGILLGRSERRVLTVGGAGAWSLELMGFADERY
jgi:hypothetical protein